MTESSNRIVIIAFDGLDYQKIQKYSCENIIQSEFGKIDNHSYMSSIKTSELFASFITGQNYKKHGIKGLSTWTNSSIAKLESLIRKVPYSQKFAEFRKGIYRSLSFLSANNIRYDKRFLQADTLFEKIENSRAMFIPSYNPSEYWQMSWDMEPLMYGFTVEKTLQLWDTREFNHREKMLLRELESEVIPLRDFLMCHFHRPDIYQHMYGDSDLEYGEKNTTGYNEQKLRKLYRETDKFAGEIREKALDKGYDRVIFMSDHGLPEGKHHNRNAFYSCNQEFFGNETPHITDFHDRIIELKDK